jgi:hypothetical protein
MWTFSELGISTKGQSSFQTYLRLVSCSDASLSVAAWHISFSPLNSMARLPSWLLDLLRRLLSRPFVTGSIERLLLLIQAIQRLFSKRIPPREKETLHTSTPTRSRISQIIAIYCSRRRLKAGTDDITDREAIYLHVSYDHDEQNIWHSPSTHQPR